MSNLGTTELKLGQWYGKVLLAPKGGLGACPSRKFSNLKALKRHFQHSQADNYIKNVPKIDRYFLLNFDKKSVVINCIIFS